MKSITSENKDQFVRDYVERIIDGMDMGTVVDVLTYYLENEKLEYTPEQLTTEILEHYPELVEDD